MCPAFLYNVWTLFLVPAFPNCLHIKALKIIRQEDQSILKLCFFMASGLLGFKFMLILYFANGKLYHYHCKIKPMHMMCQNLWSGGCGSTN